MILYRFSPAALDDLDALLYSLAEHSGWDRSMDMEEKIYSALERLGRSPGIGHLRQDLIPHDVYFDFAKPYLILYRRDTQPIYILAILHASRDIAAIMQDRLPLAATSCPGPPVPRRQPALGGEYPLQKLRIARILLTST